MVLQAMYNIVDSMFVARMPDTPGIEHTGELAVNALTLSFPIQMLIIAFGIGTGVGMGAMLSRQLGSGDKKGASRTAGNGIFLAIVIYLVFLVFAFAGIRPYLLTQSKDEVVLGMAQDYLFICIPGSLPGTDVRKQLSESLIPETPCDPASARLCIHFSR